MKRDRCFFCQKLIGTIVSLCPDPLPKIPQRRNGGGGACGSDLIAALSAVYNICINSYIYINIYSYIYIYIYSYI